jgi:serine/threonine protein kinase
MVKISWLRAAQDRQVGTDSAGVLDAGLQPTGSVAPLCTPSPMATPPPVEGHPAQPTLRTPAHGRGEEQPAGEGDYPGRLPCDFAGYELLAEVAHGGMGVVYRARQKSLGRMVALKMILPGMLGSDSAVKRFYQEAQAAGRLDHPGIVPVYEVGEHHGRHFFTMAFVEGTSLGAWVRGHGLPPLHEALHIAAAVAEAVDHAHQRGILHRDLKPDNVLIEPTGRVRITDFGLSKQIGDGQGDLTQTGQILGTPCYMAPEQATGRKEEVGPATDVFALGGVLNFLLTKHPPFCGDSITEVLYKVVHEAPIRPRAHVPSIPAAVEDVCLRCLDKDPARRYPSAGELAQALKSLAGPPSSNTHRIPQAVRHPSRRGRRAWLAAALVVLLGATAVGNYIFFGQNRRSSEARQQKAPPAQQASPKEAAPPAPPANPKEAPPPVRPAALAVGPLRRDFSLKVHLLGAAPAEKGVVRLRTGDGVRVRVEVDQDAYIGIWAIDAMGVIVQLFPHDAEPDALCKAGAPRTLPGPGFTFEAEPTNGVEQLQVVASTRPLAQIRGQKRGNFLTFQTSDEQKEWADTRRGLRLRPTAKLAEQVISYEVAPKR